MTCSNCQEKIRRTLAGIDGVSAVDVSLENSQAVLTMDTHVPDSTLNKALSAVGSYSVSIKNGHAAAQQATGSGSGEALPEKSVETYKPLIVVVGFILLATAISQVNNGFFDWMDAMRVFMGSFFLAFSFFKLLDVKGFAYAYVSYDIVARQWLGWGFIYPFVELALGTAYLTGFQPTITYAVTLVVMGVSTIGVVRSVLKKEAIKCACLGTGFNLPMSTVTIVEDVTMVVMAAVMLFI